MDKQIKIRLTPIEPYFFGGERIFDFVKGNRHYYIRSLDTPLQTTLFGALRFMGIKDTGKGFTLDDADKAQIGPVSFDIEKTGQTFGGIKGISPLYLADRLGRLYIRTPLDHKASGEKGEKYAKFEDYRPVSTSQGQRLLPADFDAKKGIADSWMCLKTEDIYPRLFHPEVRMIVNKKAQEKGLVKKEYKQLEPGFSFVFFAKVAKEFTCYQDKVFLGQSKSPFTAEVQEETEPVFLTPWLKPGLVYAQSDIYLGGETVQSLYDLCRFAFAQTRDFRAFETVYGKVRIKDRFHKGEITRLVQAGSVFWPNEGRTGDFLQIIANSHAQAAGFNRIQIGGSADESTSL